jgi:hypothetical protein
MLTTTQKARLESWNQGNADSADVPTLLDRSEKVVAVLWDFSVNGGSNAGADIALGYTFEEASIVTKVVAHVLTTVTGASSTYTIEAGATALTTATAVGSMTTGTMTLAGSATAIAVASGEILQLNIGTADATAGKVRYYIYMLPQRST